MHRANARPLVQFLVGLSFALGFAAASAEDRVIVSWDGIGAGSLNARWANTPAVRWVGNTYLASARDVNLEILEPTSEKGVRFGNISLLRVEAPANSHFAVRGRPVSSPLKKGAFEFQFAMESGKLRLSIGQNSTPFQEGVDSTIILKKEDTVLTLEFEPSSAFPIRKVEYMPASGDFLKADQVYKLKILWDFEDPSPAITITLDGQSLMNPAAGQQLRLPVEPEVAARGIDSFTFSAARSGEAKYYLGNISISEP